jgi:hypothetical protein
MTNTARFEGWCVLELMGHRRLAGMVTEVEIAGSGMLRIDVPGEDGPTATQFYSPSAVYAITPTTEAIARGFARRYRPEPVQRWELPRELAPAVSNDDNDDNDDDNQPPF